VAKDEPNAVETSKAAEVTAERRGGSVTRASARKVADREADLKLRAGANEPARPLGVRGRLMAKEEQAPEQEKKVGGLGDEKAKSQMLAHQNASAGLQARNAGPTLAGGVRAAASTEAAEQRPAKAAPKPRPAPTDDGYASKLDSLKDPLGRGGKLNKHAAPRAEAAPAPTVQVAKAKQVARAKKVARRAAKSPAPDAFYRDKRAARQAGGDLDELLDAESPRTLPGSGSSSVSGKGAGGGPALLASRFLELGDKASAAGRCSEAFGYYNRALELQPGLLSTIAARVRSCATILAREGDLPLVKAQKSYPKLSGLLGGELNRVRRARASQKMLDQTQQQAPAKSNSLK